ncbi:hypothetical protein F5Y11DRAFT_360351 [Daldinia sp. FL1419]|nr:hypothetical protein F5Y11DRAFT_360351 [Daldinia sp. FL1419]
MAENHGVHPPNGPHGAQGNVPPEGLGGRPVGQPQASVMHQQAAPPRAAVLADLARGPSVKISDVSRGLMTVDDMREELAEYLLFRFEKYPAKSRYDDEGRLQVPTWDKAIRSRVQGMSTGEIKRRIQYLSRKTRTPTDKLRSLSPALQRQIDEATNELTFQNPDPINYRWVLVQLDHQLVEVDPYVLVAGGNHPQTRRRHDVPKRRVLQHTGRSKPKSYRRVSLTTYFKRVPKAEADIPALYDAKKRMHLSQNNHITHPQSQVQPKQPPQQGMGLRAPPVGPDPTEGKPPSGPNGTRLQPIPPRPNGPGAGPRPGIVGPPMNNTTVSSGGVGKAAGIKHSRVQSDSDYSDCLLSDGSFDSQITPDTSYSSESLNRGRHREQAYDKDRVPIRNLNRQHNENMLNRDSPKYHLKHNHFVNRNGIRIPFTSEILPRMMPSIDIDKATDDAYLAGVLRGRNEARMVQQRARREAWYSKPSPRIVSRARSPTPPYRRRISTSNRREDIDDEIPRLDRLSLDDEDEYDAVLRQVGSRRRRGFEVLIQDRGGSTMGEDPFDRERPSYSRHDDRQYEDSYLTDGSDSGFSLPRRRRRVYY